MKENDILPDGMAWFGKPLTPIMIEFEKETGRKAIHKDKTTLSFLKWQKRKCKESKRKHKKSEIKIKHYRTIYQEETGELLKSDDIIHHIDLDKNNNNINNLYKTDIDGHRSLHSNIYKINKILFKMALNQNLVIFSKINNKYFITNINKKFC